MLAQGTDLVVYTKGSKAYLYTLSTGMTQITAIKSKSEITAVSCATDDSFVLIGTVGGRVYYYTTETTRETASLEEMQEVTKMSLKITSIFILEHILYIASENGIVRIISIETIYPSTTSYIQHSATLSENVTKEGWLEGIESLGEDTTETASVNISRTEGGVQIFKQLREIRHNTPINSLVVYGSSIYILDMRGRVVVQPSKVVYDNISSMHFRKYLFCVDGNTVFAEVGQVFASVYFAEEKIKEIGSTEEGGYFFIVTEKALEVVKIEGKGGRRIHTHKLSKEINNIIIDSKRSILYTIGNTKPSRIEIDYIWIDRRMEDLQIADTRVEKVHREEENENEADEYFDIPAVKAVKDAALPALKYSKIQEYIAPRALEEGYSGLSKLEREIEDPEIEELFESDRSGEDSTVLSGKMQADRIECSRNHSILNKICGPAVITKKKDKMVFWSSECTIILVARDDHTQIEVTVRERTVEVSVLKEPGKVLMGAGSPQILLLCTESHIKIYRSSEGIFTERTLVRKIEPNRKIERIVCGLECFCLVSELGLCSEVSVYSAKMDRIEEVFSTVCVVKGVAAAGAYIGLIAEEGEGVSVKLFKYEKRSVRCIASAYFNRQLIDFCGVSEAGVFIFECAGGLYALGLDRIVSLSGSITGIPVSVVGSNIAYLKESESESMSVFAESMSYFPVERQCIMNQTVNICETISKEISAQKQHTYEGEGRETGKYRIERTEEEENTIFVKKQKRVEPENSGNTSRLSVEYSESHKEEMSPMDTPVMKVRQTNPFARNE